MNAKNTKTQQSKSNNRTTLPIKRATKLEADKLLKKLNKNKLGSKIYPDDLVNFWISKMDEKLCEELQRSKVTIVDELPRLRKIWEQENNKISDEEWELLKINGQLTEFFKRHSILKLQ